MPKLKLVGGPRDGDTYNAPDGYRETGYFHDVIIPFIEDGQTRFAIYRRKKIRTPQKTIQFLDELHYVKTK